MGFEQMSRGWVKGSKDFRKAVLTDLKSDVARRVTEAEAAEMRDPRWERAVIDLLSRLGRTENELTTLVRKERHGRSQWRGCCANVT